MKQIFIVFFPLFITIYSYSQQFVGSGGTGTDEDPFLIGNYNDFVEFRSLFYNATQYTRNKYFQQIADIAIESDFWNNQIQGDFYGYFNGKGHTLLLPDTLNNYDNRFYTFFPGSQGIIDSIKVSGNVNYCFGIAQSNSGEIRNCETNVNVTIDICPYSEHSFIANNNSGLITDCINYGNLIANENEMNFYAGSIAVTNSGTISACKNHGNISGFLSIGGICTITNGTIHYCTNYGDITSPQDLIIDEFDNLPSGGIFAIVGDENDVNTIPITEFCINYGCIRAGKLYCGGGIMGSDGENTEYAGICPIIIRNCANYGDILSGKIRGGISGSLSCLSNISSCFNAGLVAYATSSGGIVGAVYDTAHIINCLDVSGMQVMIDKWEVSGDSISNMSSNYYDRQMSGGSGEDIEGETEGRLTSQLTGDTPELSAMLGDGWSYAEGRYPIPLGLENDSLAMLFATPIYLRVINDDNYDHTNLVRNNFTVGTENGVSWSSGDRLSIDGENATILASGSETATASLAGYSFSRSLRLDPITGELVATDCDSYLWNGNEYTASGDYIQVLTASNGCDSIVTLHLTINNSVHYSFTETATSPYIWNGTEYTETGDYTQNFTSANGCDSIVTLHLNILSGISQDGTAEISVFPTPVTDILNITSSETISEIEIINVMGQVVKCIEVNSDSAVCDVEDLRSGVYVVRIHAASTTLSLRRFVKE